MLREKIRIKWGIKQNEMWRNLILKTDLEKDPSKFWKEIKGMKGTKRQEIHKIIKDENGRRLETNEEVVEAFKKELTKNV